MEFRRTRKFCTVKYHILLCAGLQPIFTNDQYCVEEEEEAHCYCLSYLFGFSFYS
jgi:hypothetical protein